MLIDSHTHMDSLEIPIEDVIKLAKENNVTKIITNSTSYESNIKNLEIAEKFEEIYPSLGLYPMNMLELTEEEINRAFDFFEENYKKVVAIGEVGIDWKLSTNESERERQQRNFERFIDFSIEKNLPITIHSRYAIKKAIQTIENKEAKKVYFHSYTDSFNLMSRAARQGYYCGCGLIVMWDELVQERIRKFPLENLLIETDAPIRFEDKLSYPDKISLIYKKVAEIKDIDVKEVEKQVEKNNKELFGI